MSEYLSSHLTVAEFLATSHRELLVAQESAWIADTALQRNAARLARDVFEPVREALGVPLHVNSGFRCPTLNAAVGGRPGSLHLEALAIDVVPVGIEPQVALFYLLRVMRRGRLPAIDKVIVECGRWLHIQAARDGVAPQQLAMVSEDGRTFATVT